MNTVVIQLFIYANTLVGKFFQKAFRMNAVVIMGWRQKEAVVPGTTAKGARVAIISTISWISLTIIVLTNNYSIVCYPYMKMVCYP